MLASWDRSPSRPSVHLNRFAACAPATRVAAGGRCSVYVGLHLVTPDRRQFDPEPAFEEGAGPRLQRSPSAGEGGGDPRWGFHWLHLTSVRPAAAGPFSRAIPERPPGHLLCFGLGHIVDPTDLDARLDRELRGPQSAPVSSIRCRPVRCVGRTARPGTKRHVVTLTCTRHWTPGRAGRIDRSSRKA
jgi:hypothetical protein